MLSRLANVLQELSGEEGVDGGPQDMLVPHLPGGEDQVAMESEAPEEAMERLAHLEQLVVQLKELIREKDSQLGQKDTELKNKVAQFKNEKEDAEARFTKLKLQAKARMASLNKQIAELKGSGGETVTQSPDSSFTAVGAAVEEELQDLKNKLSQEETKNMELQQLLQSTKDILQEKESAHAEQLQKLQAVVCEKDVRFQEQIQKHEEELMKVTTQTQNDGELMEALTSAQRRCEELEEALKSRAHVVEMLQEEVSSADQQKQILTAQFRQMEQELAEAMKLREEEKQQWSKQTDLANAELAALRTSVEALESEREEISRQASELISLREAERDHQDALEKERIEVSRLQSELALSKEAEQTAIQMRHDATEREAAEKLRLEIELASLREHQSSQDTVEKQKSETEQLETELLSLKEKQEDAQKKEAIFFRAWRHLQSLTRSEESAEEENLVPEDPSLLLDTVQSLDNQLKMLKEKEIQSEQHCSDLTHTMETLHEQLERKNTEHEGAAIRMQQLEEQIMTLSQQNDATESSTQNSSETDKAHILQLQQQLLEKDSELAALRESLTSTKPQDYTESTAGETHEQDQKICIDHHDSSSAIPDAMEETQEEDTTLVAEETSVLSVSADNGSPPELIGNQSPEESKVTSSDEMVTSTDSEVAHSSWTLLEAVNQDGGQEWPSTLQDLGHLQLQSWETTSMEQETSMVQVESSSVIIRETVQVHVTQQNSSSTDADVSSGQAFAEALAEELQKKYSELLLEMQNLRDTAAESQERIRNLEEETRFLTAAKEAAESQADKFADELQSTKVQLESVSQQSTSVQEKQMTEIQLLEEQVEILCSERKAKEEKIQSLQSDLETTHQALSEQDGQVRMLSAQLEDRELLTSELERKLQDIEGSLMEYSQTSDLNNETLSKKDSEISDLQLRLSQREQEMMEFNNSMSAKLLQIEEEKFQKDCEVNKLREQMVELEKTREAKEDSGAHGEDELLGLQKEKKELETQLTNMKKKLQASLVQRKELMKKVTDLEADAKQQKERDESVKMEMSASAAEAEETKGPDREVMEAKVLELEQALGSKEEMLSSLEQKISEQDQIIADTLALNKKLSEEAENREQTFDNTSEITVLHTRVATLEADCETLQKKVQEAQESRKDTIRKAKEKDRHHREQMKQHKEEYNELVERFEAQVSERDTLFTKLRELEDSVSARQEDLTLSSSQKMTKSVEKHAAGEWVQEDWVDFATADGESSQPPTHQQPQSEEAADSQSVQIDEPLEVLRKEIQAVQMVNTELEMQLQETQAGLLRKETEVLDLSKELEALREKENQIEALSAEVSDLREKYLQSETHAETIKAEMEAATKATSSESASSIAALQSEVEGFKQFLDSKNQEILGLSQQLSEQNSLIHSMQVTVSEKDQLITSLQEELKVEQEKSQRLEVEVPQKQEEGDEAKIKQLQQKLKAALISRKDTMKENKLQKEQLASAEQLTEELKQKLGSAEGQLEKVSAERLKLIEEVDRALLENQSLGSSCESFKLAMDGLLTEKDACKREAEFAKQEVTRINKEWQEKNQSMKEEYETLLKSYENVSDEAERVRRVLEAARQERQELMSKVRTHEVAKQEAELQAEEARKEVDLVKDKMRKFAKTKQQKILELEEENERLREIQERSGMKVEDSPRSDEIGGLEEELQALKCELNDTMSEKVSLGKLVEELKEQLHQMQMKEEVKETSKYVEEVFTVKSEVLLTKAEINKDQCEEPPIQEDTSDHHLTVVTTSETQSHTSEKTGEEVVQSSLTLLEDKIREMEATYNKEKGQWQQQEAGLEAQLVSLRQDLQESQEKISSLASVEKCMLESKDREQSLMEEASKRETQFKELLQILETEKDNLEERLMNQLAQLNGSIAGYQQEVTQNREQLADMQREVEKLERERAELEAEAQSVSDRASRLEEDVRQAQRERAEAEAECGKQRELEQQLKSAERVREGSQSRAQQLEELLKEKQTEVRQLQKESIHHQERISELSKETKTRQHSNDELSKRLKRYQQEASTSQDDLNRVQAELAKCKSHLDTAQKQLSDTLAENAAMVQNHQKRIATMKEEAEQTLDSVRFRLGAELKELELRLEESDKDREKEEEATLKAREMTDAAERRAQELQVRLDESLSRLYAFSKSMCSLQDDRDRVLDEARQWETRFNAALQVKEDEARKAEIKATNLAEQLQKETALKDELQLSVNRLETADKDWQLRMEEEKRKRTDLETSLQEEKSKLEQTTSDLHSAQNEVQSLTSELEGLRHRLKALEEAVGQLQDEVQKGRTELKERESEERRLCLNVEQLETDLRSSKSLTESLQSELHEKEAKEVEMLVEREQAVAQAAEEARTEADARAQSAEKELEQRRAEVRGLEDKLKKAEEDCKNAKAKLDSFTKAMGSLQGDRDRVLNIYKELEEKHLQVMMEKDDLIQEAATENNSLKEELRSLLVQRDDLYAERAKLSAQLHGYRDELNQVLSMKDSQHKQLLAAQREQINTLEREREELESELKEVRRARETQEEAVVKVEMESLSQAAEASKTIDAPGAEVEKLREQLQAARAQVEEMEETLAREREGQDSRNKELAELRWEGGVMRTESESAQERVAELARDLLVMEQQLLEEKEATTQLRAENQSFAKAMASLQDSRDEAETRAEELNQKLKEMSKAGGAAGHGGSGGSTGEVWGLKNALQALQNDRERLLEKLQNQESEVQKQKVEMARLGAGELIKVSQELFEEKKKNEDMLGVLTQLENMVEVGKQEVETLRLERVDWMAQAEQLKQQTLVTLSERDHQLRQLTAMLEEAHSQRPKLQQEHYQRQGTEKVDSPPGAPQERSSSVDSHSYATEVKELMRRLDDEIQQRISAEEQLMVMQEQLKRRSSTKLYSDQDGDHSETSVLIEPPEGAVTKIRRGGPGLKRMLRVAFCSRQRTPLLCSLYLLTVHVLLLLCMGGYL